MAIPYFRAGASRKHPARKMGLARQDLTASCSTYWLLFYQRSKFMACSSAYTLSTIKGCVCVISVCDYVYDHR